MEIGAGNMTDTKKLSYTTCRKGREFYAQRYTNGELRYIITELKDGQGIGIEKGGKYGVKNGYIRIIKGERNEKIIINFVCDIGSFGL